MTDSEDFKKINTFCPICGKITSEKYHPFCSKRCADIDLYHWLNGNYAIPESECSDDDKKIPDESNDR